MYVQWHVHVDDITVIYTHIKSFEWSISLRNILLKSHYVKVLAFWLRRAEWSLPFLDKINLLMKRVLYQDKEKIKKYF